jgi:hypothetical protein
MFAAGTRTSLKITSATLSILEKPKTGSGRTTEIPGSLVGTMIMLCCLCLSG